MKQHVFPNFIQALFYAKVVNIVIATIVGLLIGTVYLVLDQYDSFNDDMSQKFGYLGTLLLLPGLFIILWKGHLNIFDNTKFEFSVNSFICIFLIEFISFYIVISYGALCNLYREEFFFLDGMNIYALLGNIILAPVIEEILFRKIILNQFLKQYSILASLLLSTFIFSLHGQIFSHPLLFFSYFFTGFLFGVIYYKTNSVVYSIIAHSFYNLLINFPIFKIIENINKIQIVGFLTSFYNLFLVVLLMLLLLVILWKMKKKFKPNVF